MIKNTHQYNFNYYVFILLFLIHWNSNAYDFSNVRYNVIDMQTIHPDDNYYVLAVDINNNNTVVGNVIVDDPAIIIYNTQIFFTGTI